MNDTCVIGWPITHSRSPIIHNYWRKRYQIGGVYEKCPVAPEDLKTFIKDLPKSRFIGCNVTLPHKEQVISWVSQLDPKIKTLGAANTIYLREQETHATSTDGEGFIQNLNQHQPKLNLAGKKIVILGAGGSAKTLIAAFLSQNCKHIHVVNRTLEKIAPLQMQFGSQITAGPYTDLQVQLSNCDLLVNTTSLGMAGQPPLNISLDGLASHAVVADIVYVPLITDFLKQAERRGHAIVPGLGMLLHQAVGGFALWHGVKPEVTPELFALVEADLRKDQNL